MALEDPDEFFRLNVFEILIKTTLPSVGYSYKEGDINFTITGLNAQREVNRIEIGPR